MNLYHLKYFVTLAHLEHYTKAAEQLSITQPSLSHAIAYLESELKVQLFQKNGRNIVLTKAGHNFLAKAESILNDLDKAVTEMQMTDNMEGPLDIGFVRCLGIDFLPDILKDYKSDHPDKRIQFRLHNGGGLSASIIEALKTQKYDLAFCSKYKNDPLIDFIPVEKQNLVLITPLDHPLAKYDEINLINTVMYPYIAFNPRSGLRGVIDNLFEIAGEHPKICMEIEEDQVIAGLVSKNFGIAVVPEMFILNHLPVKKIKIVDPEPKRFFYMATLKNAYRTALADNFIKYVESRAISEE